MRYAFAVATMLVLAGCAAPRPAPIAPPPVFTSTSRPATPPVAPAPLPADWNDWPFTPGDWTYRRSDGGALAMFGTAQVMVRCDLARRAILLRVDGAVGNLTVRTTALTRTIAVAADGGAMAVGSATLSATDPLLDAIAFSRGRFVLERAGQPALVLPPYAEIGRVIEDCRG